MSSARYVTVNNSFDLSAATGWRAFKGPMRGPYWLPQAGSGTMVFGDDMGIYGCDSKGKFRWMIPASYGFSGWTIYNHQDLYVVDGHLLFYYNLNAFGVRGTALNALDLATGRSWNFQMSQSYQSIFSPTPRELCELAAAERMVEWLQFLTEAIGYARRYSLRYPSRFGELCSLFGFIDPYDSDGLTGACKRAQEDLARKRESASRYLFAPVIAQTTATTDKRIFTLSASGAIYPLARDLSVSQVRESGAVPQRLELFFTGSGASSTVSFLAAQSLYTLDIATMTPRPEPLPADVDTWMAQHRCKDLVEQAMVSEAEVVFNNSKYLATVVDTPRPNEFVTTPSTNLSLAAFANADRMLTHLLYRDAAGGNAGSPPTSVAGPKLAGGFLSVDGSGTSPHIVGVPWVRTEADCCFVHALAQPTYLNAKLLDMVFAAHPDSMRQGEVDRFNAAIQALPKSLAELLQLKEGDPSYLPAATRNPMSYLKIKLLDNPGAADTSPAVPRRGEPQPKSETDHVVIDKYLDLSISANFKCFKGTMRGPYWLPEAGNGTMVLGDDMGIYGCDVQGNLLWQIGAQYGFAGWTLYNHQDLYVIDGHVLSHYDLNSIHVVNAPVHAFDFFSHKPWNYSPTGPSYRTLFASLPPELAALAGARRLVEWLGVLSDAIKQAEQHSLKYPVHFGDLCSAFGFTGPEDTAVLQAAIKQAAADLEQKRKEAARFLFAPVIAPTAETQEKRIFTLGANGTVYSFGRDLSFVGNPCRTDALPSRLELFLVGRGVTASVRFLTEKNIVSVDATGMTLQAAVPLPHDVESWTKAHRCLGMSGQTVRKECPTEFRGVAHTVRSIDVSEPNELAEVPSDNRLFAVLASPDTGRNRLLYLDNGAELPDYNGPTLGQTPSIGKPPRICGGWLLEAEIVDQPWLRTEEKDCFVHALLRGPEPTRSLLRTVFACDAKTFAQDTDHGFQLDTLVEALKAGGGLTKASILAVDDGAASYLPALCRNDIAYAKIRLLENAEASSVYSAYWDQAWLKSNTQKHLTISNWGQMDWFGMSKTLAVIVKKVRSLAELANQTGHKHHPAEIPALVMPTFTDAQLTRPGEFVNDFSNEDLLDLFLTLLFGPEIRPVVLSKRVGDWRKIRMTARESWRCELPQLDGIDFNQLFWSWDSQLRNQGLNLGETLMQEMTGRFPTPLACDLSNGRNAVLLAATWPSAQTDMSAQALKGLVDGSSNLLNALAQLNATIAETQLLVAEGQKTYLLSGEMVTNDYDGSWRNLGNSKRQLWLSCIVAEVQELAARFDDTSVLKVIKPFVTKAATELTESRDDSYWKLFSLMRG